jgi:CheY-like chemotaxis protein
VEVAVSDSGTGIAPEFLPFVFEPFRQGDGSVAREHGGLGLGLAISKQLVELHGGTVIASSPGLGRGATFLIRLPAQADIASSSVPAGTPAGPVSVVAADASMSLAGVDVLIVDDDEDSLALFRESLESTGASVRAVTSAAAAIREDADRPAALLVTDLALPAMDGFELLRAIRATNPGVCAVAVTAYARLDDRARSLAGGFQAHVAKPVDPKAFVRTLIAVVSNAR